METNTSKKTNVYAKLLAIQKEIKVGKSRFNQFGNFNYRTAEDIFQALKPLLDKVGATVVLNDQIEVIGDRFFVKAICKFIDIETGEIVETVAYAQMESAAKNTRMSEPQLTGSASTYARKYALNAMFLLDDAEDPDSIDNNTTQELSKIDALYARFKQKAKLNALTIEDLNKAKEIFKNTKYEQEIINYINSKK